ncbi:MAG: hypothetical protein CSB03_00635, partial [Bacteroidia bacterium]
KELKKERLYKQREQQKERDRKRQAIQQIKPLLYALALWLVLMMLAHIADYYWHIAEDMIKFVVASTILIGNSLGFDVAQTIPPNLQVAGFNMQVIFECTAYNFYLFVVALVLFARWTWQDKLINFAIFIVSIFLLNTSRFIIMGYIGSAFPSLFHQIHDYVWTILFALLTAGLYMWRNQKYNR